MKYKLKTRLFAALALSGVSFYWPATPVVAQEDDFGFIRPAEPTRQDDQINVPPITRANPPIVERALVTELLMPSSAIRPPAAMPPVVQSPSARSRSASSAPVPFASSNVFNGAYVAEGNAGVSHAQHQFPAQNLQQPSSRQVSHQEPFIANEPPPIVNGINAERDLPPVVRSADSSLPQIVQAIEQNEVPPIILSCQAGNETEVPPIVTPDAGLDRLLSPIETNDSSGSLLTADGSSIDEASSVQPAGFGANPLVVQDAPPIIGSISDEVVPGELPSSDGALTPIDPTVDLLGGESFPRATPDSATMAPQSVFEQSLPLQQPTSPRETYFEPVAQQAPVYGGCSTCGAGGGNCGCNGGGCSGVSSCSSCGENGCFDPAVVEGMFNCSGSNAYARRYLIVEALYFDRTDGLINNSNFGTLNNFVPDIGARLTVGRRSDSTRGREFQYSGVSAVEQTRRVFNGAGLAQSRFVPNGGLSGANLRAFFNATEQSQAKETYYHSLEFNRVKWGWDVMKSYFGMRYMYVDDEYTLFSQSRRFTAAETGGAAIEPESGAFQMAAVNHLFGPHIGGELYYDVGYRWSLSGVSRAGVYANLNRFDTRLTNNGTRFIDVEDTNATIAFSYEAGLNAKFRLTKQAQVRFGYNLIYLDNMATVSDNLLNNAAIGGISVSPTLGAATTDSDSMFLHGLSFGLEIYR